VTNGVPKPRFHRWQLPSYVPVACPYGQPFTVSRGHRRSAGEPSAREHEAQGSPEGDGAFQAGHASSILVTRSTQKT
jgi:hypothetical protein